jgi:spore coat protein H
MLSSNGLLLLASFWTAALPRAAIPDALFTHDRVLRISIELGAPQIQALKDTPREYVRGRIRNDTNVLAGIEARLKGNYTFQPIDEKPGFSLKLSSPTAQNQFGGRKRLLLNNSLQDSSYLRAKLASELFLKAGLPTARINFATVTLNGRNLGLYLLVEGTDEQFLVEQFGLANGNLYEGADTDIGQPLEIDFSRKGTDRSDLHSLLAACTEQDLAKRWTQLKQRLEVGRFASFMAMELLVAHIDGYCMDRNNYRLFHDDRSGQFTFVAHGMDLTFLNHIFKQDRPWRGAVALGFYEIPEGRRLYHQRVRELGANVYGQSAALNKRVEELWRLIGPTFLDTTEKENALAAVRELQSTLEKRAKSFPHFIKQIK